MPTREFAIKDASLNPYTSHSKNIEATYELYEPDMLHHEANFDVMPSTCESFE